MSTQLLFYKEPTVLEKEKHADLTFKREGHYGYASAMNSAPVAGVEFTQASHDHPILFVKNEKSGFIPVVLLSLKKDGHDLGDDWSGLYVPAFIRRYPFGVTPEGAIVFDKEAPHFSGEGEAIFDENKEPTETLKQIVGFLRSVDTGYSETEEFCKALNEKDMLQPLNRALKFGEQQVNLTDLYKLDESKLYELDEKELHSWFAKKWIAWCHAHLHSLAALNDVAKRHMEVLAAAEGKAE